MIVVITIAIFSLGAVQPSILGVPNSVITLPINVNTSGDVQLIAAVANQTIYVTHYHIVSSGATTFQFDYGTGSNCGSGTTTIDGPMSFIATTGISAGIGFGAVIVVPAGNALCINLGTNSVQVGGTISYQQGN